MSEENKYPCAECEEDEQHCNRQRKYLRCTAWRKWFRAKWAEIREMFDFNVSKGHNEKEGDLNE
jgi:hypothetical protein